MFEMIDAFVTATLTAMVYGVPVLTTISFILFVVTQLITAETVAQTVEDVPITAVDAEAQLAQPIKQALVTAPATTIEKIVCEPINWSTWKVTDLRTETFRELFSIQLRINNKVCKKAELISQYRQAMQSV